MKILGIGVDIIQNLRIKKSFKNKSFIKRTFGKNEIKRAKNIIGNKPFLMTYGDGLSNININKLN